MLHFLLDANAVNARQEDQALNELENLGERGCINLEFTETSYAEAEFRSIKRSHKLEKYTWIGVTNQLGFENEWRESISKIVFPGKIFQKLSTNERNDVEIILTAKMMGATLVTNNGNSRSQPRGILGSKNELAELGIQVVSPKEALILACDAINKKC